MPKRSIKDVARELRYPELREERRIGGNALTVEDMKGLLGWQEVTAENKDGPEPLLKDRRGALIRCLNNLNNRPFYPEVMERLVQTILTRKWRYNGEPIIIGQYGSVLNGQHTMVAGCIAEQERTTGNEEKRRHWGQYWKGPITLEKLVVYGIEESDEVINTMDTNKPRSLADVIYRSEYFRHSKALERKTFATMTDWAIRTLWGRLGVKDDPFASKRTHSAALDFLERHPKLLKCVKHIHEQNSNQTISELVKPGTAAAYLYLMATSSTEGDSYHQTEPPTEKRCRWDHQAQAERFWTLFAAKEKPLLPVRSAIISLNNGTVSEKAAVLAKAWTLYVQEQPLERDAIKPTYDEDQDGIRFQSEWPTFGGIDLGDPAAREMVRSTGDVPQEDQPEILERLKAEERQRRMEGETPDNGSTSTDTEGNGEGQYEAYHAPSTDQEVADEPAEETKATTEAVDQYREEPTI